VLGGSLFTGGCPNLFFRLLSDKGGKRALFNSQRSFPNDSKARLHSSERYWPLCVKIRPCIKAPVSLARSPPQESARDRSSSQSSQSEKVGALDFWPNFLRGRIRPSNLLWIGLSPIQRKFPLRLRVLCEKLWRGPMCSDIFAEKILIRNSVRSKDKGQSENASLGVVMLSS
jgi:hypothetical protein